MDNTEKGELQRRFGNGWWYECAMTVAGRIPNGREKSLVLTKLEEAMHWEQAALEQPALS